MYRKEIGILAGIDGKKIPATELNDDWIHAGRLKEKADQGDEEARTELEEMDPPFYSWTEIDRV